MDAVPRKRVANSSFLLRHVDRGIDGVMRALDTAFPLKPGRVARVAVSPTDHLAFRPRHLNEWFMAFGLWEPYVHRALPLSPADVFIDVGAHIGYHSRFAAERVGEEGVVIAIEADARNIPLLERNLAGFPQVTIVPMACAEHEGTSWVRPASNPLFTEIGESVPGSQAVKTITLDAVAGMVPPRALRGERNWFVKIDVEGSELGVVRGGRALVDRFQPLIVVESYAEHAAELHRILPSYDITAIAVSYYRCAPPKRVGGDRRLP